MASRRRVVALLTDFGTHDAYVGVLKGVLLGFAPEAQVVDLSHDVPAQDIRSARRLLASAVPYFPESTVFVVVVDPGVGTDRCALAARREGRLFVAPDNGLLAFLDQGRPAAEFRRIDADRWGLRPRSATFHGRDVFAPVAGRLASGLAFGRVGAVVARIEPGPPEPAASSIPGGLAGAVVAVDRFGTLVTNLRATDLEMLGTGGSLEVRLGARRLGAVRRTFADVPTGRPVCFVGSFGELEIAVRDGDAARRFRCGVGAPVVVRAVRAR
ncbi:MAG: SAM-dependent chlorinase/fluorinase [Planctomycetes bacterium]|nr:SAM-dependent chlorinase/fluorinase [Planctomycetota bacterium]